MKSLWKFSILATTLCSATLPTLAQAAPIHCESLDQGADHGFEAVIASNKSKAKIIANTIAGEIKTVLPCWSVEFQDPSGAGTILECTLSGRDSMLLSLSRGGVVGGLQARLESAPNAKGERQLLSNLICR